MTWVITHSLNSYGFEICITSLWKVGHPEEALPRISLACSHVLFSWEEVIQESSWECGFHLEGPGEWDCFRFQGRVPTKTWKILCVLALEIQIWIWILDLPLMNEQMDISVIYLALWVCQELSEIWAVLIHLTFTIILSCLPIYRNGTVVWQWSSCPVWFSLTQWCCPDSNPGSVTLELGLLVTLPNYLLEIRICRVEVGREG